jgi:hypothetical protein
VQGSSRCEGTVTHGPPRHVHEINQAADVEEQERIGAKYDIRVV